MEYNLSTNEVVLVQPFFASLVQGITAQAGEMMLTNKYLYWEKNRLFNRKSEPEKYSINKIKTYEGKPQILIDNHGGFMRFQVHLDNQTLVFNYNSKRDVLDLISEVNKLFGYEETESFDSKNALPGAEFVAKKVAGTVNAFKNAFGVKPKQEVILTKFCMNCGAQITGPQGKSVTCEYCGSSQIIE